MSNKYEWDVYETRERLDRFLQKRFDSSRSQIEQLIKKGFVYVDSKSIQKPGYIVKPGQNIRVTLPQLKDEEKRIEDIPFDIQIIYEDEEIIVINKPPGVVVHPAPSVKEPTVVDWLKKENFTLSTLSGEERHGIVHRLDKETSGLMVIAKNNDAHRNLAKQLQEKTMGRYYLAIITPPLKTDMIIEKPIARNPKNRLKMGVVANGKYAKSAFAKIALNFFSTEELIGAKLFTGRTHQIRVHLSSIHRHILGDSLYGFKSKKDIIKRVFLHAYILYIRHPKTGRLMQFVAPIPDDMQHYLKNHFDMEIINEKIKPNTFDSLFDFSDRM